MPRFFILISKAEIQDACAVNGPLAIGFPSITAFYGAAIQIQRHLNQDEQYQDIMLKSVGVCSHYFHMRSNQKNDALAHFDIPHLYSGPLREKGTRDAINPQPICDFTVSLLLEFEGVNSSNMHDICADVENAVYFNRIASGDCVSIKSVELLSMSSENIEKTEKDILRKLLPGFAMVSRPDLLNDMQNQAENDVTAFMSNFTKSFTWIKSDTKEKGSWKLDKTAIRPGWIVPMCVGYKAISELSTVKGQRSSEREHIFAEGVTTLGEFIVPIRLNLNQMLWVPKIQPDKGLYLYSPIESIISNHY